MLLHVNVLRIHTSLGDRSFTAWRGGSMVGCRIRDQKVAGSPPRSMCYHITTLGKLFTCTCLCPPSSISWYQLQLYLVHHRSGASRLAAPASLIPVVAVVFICGLSDVLINEYLFIYLCWCPRLWNNLPVNMRDSELTLLEFCY